MKKILLIFMVLLSVFIVEAQQQGEVCKIASERINNLYCSIDGYWETVKNTNDPCINDFECSSEICQDGVCQDQDIISLLAQAISQLPPPAQPSGGGGGGGGSSSYSGIISSYQKAASGCFPQWNCTKWSTCINGKKTRTCKDDKGCTMDEPFFNKPAESMLCMLLTPSSCEDETMNQGEEGIDCGGPCSPCATCSDSEQNCHDGLCETGIDCGGTCVACEVPKTFLISAISGLLVLLLVGVGLLYWKLKGEAKELGREEVVWEHEKKHFRL